MKISNTIAIRYTNDNICSSYDGKIKIKSIVFMPGMCIIIRCFHYQKKYKHILILYYYVCSRKWKFFLKNRRTFWCTFDKMSLKL